MESEAIVKELEKHLGADMFLEEEYVEFSKNEVLICFRCVWDSESVLFRAFGRAKGTGLVVSIDDNDHVFTERKEAIEAMVKIIEKAKR